MAPKQDRRKNADWNQKSAQDADRINKHLQKRAQLKDGNAITKDDAPPPAPPKATGKPLLRLREKVNEIYNTPKQTDDDKEPLFNISLLEEETNEEKFTKQSAETIRITKEQQLAGKLNMIMSSSMAAAATGLPAKATVSDSRLAQSAEYNLKKIRKRTLEEKIESPLNLKGHIKEKDLTKAAAGIKKATQTLPADALAGLPADEAKNLAKPDSKEELAELILKKSGRGPKKKPFASKSRPSASEQNGEPKQETP